MEKPDVSNYEKLCESWRQKILGMDVQELLRKLPELRQEGDYLTLYHFGRKFGVHKETGTVKAMEDDGPVSVGSRMNIYNLFWYSKADARFQDRWVPFRDVKDAGPFAPAFEKHVLLPFARTFTGKTEQLLEAAKKLGADMVKQGDAGFILRCFDCIPIQYLFWDADEEFPAQGNILFDYSVTDRIHVESTVSLATDGVIRLAETAGVPLQGSIFNL